MMMGALMNVAPRKSPRQTRAKVTVDAIVEATTELLLQEGYDRLTTARVAERAGVSVGSLYQYFPNKAALACAVIDRCCDGFLGAFSNALAGRSRANLTDGIAAIVDVGLVSHHLAPELHRIVGELAPRLGVGDRAERVSRAVMSEIETVLREHAAELAPEIDPATAAAIIEPVLQALSHRVGLADPAQLANGALVRQATRLVSRYLAA